MQYGIRFSTKHPSETNNNFENSYVIKKDIGLKYFADIRFEMFLFQIDRQN